MSIKLNCFVEILYRTLVFMLLCLADAAMEVIDLRLAEQNRGNTKYRNSSKLFFHGVGLTVTQI